MVSNGENKGFPIKAERRLKKIEISPIEIVTFETLKQ